ncbi:hypothetical protein ACFPZI_24555 [Streptomyces chlorus]|uniref:Uncharacterized protein n=1 Tax=Streptomyces chlorus TaxID=887452 RepID=A0ABW1E1X2_9ACTN
MRAALLKRAFEGRLVAQHPEEESAAPLLARIATERAAQSKPKRTRKAPAQRAAEAAGPEPTLAPALEDADSGLPPEEIVRDLQSALNEFTAIARSLGGEVDVPEAEVE